MDQILETRKLLGFALQDAEGDFETDALLAAACRNVVYGLRFSLDQGNNQRNPQRPFLAPVGSVPGARFGRTTFEIEARGSGTAGLAPAEDSLLIASGCAKTINSGVASSGSVIEYPRNTGTGVPNIIGTIDDSSLVNNFSGWLKITVMSNLPIRVSVEICLPGLASNSNINGVFVSPAITVTGTPANITTYFDSNILGVSGFTIDSTGGWSPAIGDIYTMDFTSSETVNVEYKEASTPTACGSLVGFQDGTLVLMHSCRGNKRFVGKTGGVPRYSFDMQGVIITADSFDDGNFPSGVAFPNVVPVAVLNEYLRFSGVAPPCWTDFEIDWKRDVKMVACAGEESGYHAARIVGYTGPVSGKFNPLAQLRATYDPYAAVIAGTRGAGLGYRHGSVAGNIIEIESQINQIVSVKENARDGHLANDIEFEMPAPEYSAGSDYSPTVIRYR